MSYTPTEWKTGDVITAERLNKAEQGIKDAHDNAADISSEVATEVASWLDEHINVTEGVNIDDTLSVAGSAADAKATGDKVNDLKSVISQLADTLSPMTIYPIAGVTSGKGITAATGAEGKSTHRAILPGFDLHFYNKLTSVSPYVFLFYGYDCGSVNTWEYNALDTELYQGYLKNADGDLTKSETAYWTNEIDVKKLLARYPTYYWRIVVRRSDESGSINFGDVQSNYTYLKSDKEVKRLRAEFIRYFDSPSGLRDIRLYAHQGFNVEAPGNSLPAFDLAGQYGFWGIETDFRKTADNVIVCMHNETIDATTDGTGAVSSLTAAQLAQYHIDTGAHVSDYTPEQLKIPTIDDYLTICRKYGMVPYIELKETGLVDIVIDKLKRYGLYNVAIISSDTASILQETRVKTDLFVHWIRLSQTAYDARVMSYLGNSGESYNYTDLDTVPASLCENMNLVGVAYCFRAADTVADVKKQAELGVYYIPTNAIKPSDII